MSTVPLSTIPRHAPVLMGTFPEQMVKTRTPCVSPLTPGSAVHHIAILRVASPLPLAPTLSLSGTADGPLACVPSCLPCPSISPAFSMRDLLLVSLVCVLPCPRCVLPWYRTLLPLIATLLPLQIQVGVQVVSPPVDPIPLEYGFG